MWRYRICVDLRNALVDARLFVCFAFVALNWSTTKWPADLFAPGIDSIARLDNSFAERYASIVD